MAKGDIATGPGGERVVLDDVGQEIVYENEDVRVWEISLAPGERQRWHRHHNPYVVVALEPADNRIDPLDGGEPRAVHEAAGGVVYRAPGETHMLTNTGATHYRSRLIELKFLGENGGERS